MKYLNSVAGLLFGYALTLLASPVIHAAESEEENPRLPLAMEVFLRKPKDHQYDIHIHLTNVSTEPVRVDVHDLPWTPPNDSKWLSLVRQDEGQTQIEQHIFPGEFGNQMVRLDPGESVQDKIVLNYRVPSLLKDIERFGIQLRWECPPPSLKFICKPGVPQTITIAKGDTGKPDAYAIDEAACRRLGHTIGLIRIPENHEVLFLLTTESIMSDLNKVQALLYQVDEYVERAVSFFTDEKFAGFLRDNQGKQLFERGLWQQTNIGQYSSQIRKLYRFPWVRTKAESVYLSVYRGTHTSEVLSHSQ